MYFRPFLPRRQYSTRPRTKWPSISTQREGEEAQKRCIFLEVCSKKEVKNSRPVLHSHIWETNCKKSIKPHHCKCQNKCKEFSNNDRKAIFHSYYSLGSYERQRDYILQNITEKPCFKKTQGTKSNREKSYEYFLPMGNTKKPVCQKFFTNTLDITRKMIRVAISKRNPVNPNFVMKDRRGRAKGHRGIPLETRKNVKAHIETFPSIEAHYVRKTSNRKYLSSNLNINKMYVLYMDEHRLDDKAHVKQSTYRYIFNSEYNLSFHKPKKDQCLTCHKLKNGNAEQKMMYDRHIQEKARAQKEKQSDKIEAQENATYNSYTFDLQSMLYTPCLNLSPLYYTRKLCVYNLTCFDQATKDGTCYLWNETDGLRGSSEIGK